MPIKINFNPKLITALLLFILFSCQEKENVISSKSLNKADGLYKYKEKLFTGKVLDTTNSGRVILTFNCIEGKLNGKYLKYYAVNGNLKQKSTYENGIKTGPYLNLKKDGDTVTYGNFLNYKRNGLWKEYYRNGNLKSVGLYQKNLQNGEWKYYHSNGNIKAIGNYENGDKSKLGDTYVPISGRYGEWNFYSYETGEIQLKGEFKNGKRSGQYVMFYPNGQIKAKAVYKNDELDGLHEIFNKSGKPETIEVWENGKKISSK